MTATFVVDSSVAVKWVLAESGSVEALLLHQKGVLIAPELLMAECANVFWKKVVRGEINVEKAFIAGRALEEAEIELVSMRALVQMSTALAITLAHPAYDCAYLALALQRDCRFITADQRLIARVRDRGDPELASRMISLSDVARLP